MSWVAVEQTFNTIEAVAVKKGIPNRDATLTRDQVSQMRRRIDNGENPRKVLDYRQHKNNPVLQAALIHHTGYTGQAAQRDWPKIRRAIRRRISSVQFTGASARQTQLTANSLSAVARAMGLTPKSSPSANLKAIDRALRGQFQKGNAARARLRNRSKG